MELLDVGLPLLAFMLIPVWIPLIAIAVGAIGDRISPPRSSPAQVAVRDAKAQSLALRTRAHAPAPAYAESLAA
ncbi:hypothetical protein [Marmoricola sp. RAF53]|uniref:hypothetical protein n=1 Tax=Marmoricola sp. RAF53 TaxID=3233059 RepID=UPI003F9EAB1B